MAEDVTPSPGMPGGAAQAVNPPIAPASPGASDPPPTPTPAEAPWTAKGYKSWDEVDQTIERHKSAITGSQAEANRLRQETQQTREALERRESQFQTLLTALGGKTAETTPQPLSLKQAFDAYINGDEQAVTRYETHMRQPAVTPDALQQQVVGVLQTALKPAQYADAVARNHPELNNPQDPLFQAVWSQYDIAAADPSVALFFPPEPAAVRTYTGPDGVTRNIDLRVVNQLALQIKAQTARETGRKEELERQKFPTLPGPGTMVKPTDDDAPLLTADERRFIRENLRSLPPEWGSTEEAVVKHKWDKLMNAQEKARRKAARATGATF